jgi:hypothetical protein
MTYTTDRPKEQLYEYRGKQFMSDEWTINQLNYALALNHSKERYVLVKKSKKKDGDN